MTAGSVLIYDGRPVHGGGPTRSDSGRIGLIVEHVARWRRPNENHTLTVPIRLAATLLELLQEFLGYNQLNPYLGFVAGRSPREWLHGPGEPNT